MQKKTASCAAEQQQKWTVFENRTESVGIPSIVLEKMFSTCYNKKKTILWEVIMLRITKKTIALFLTVLLTALLAVPAFAALEGDYSTPIPTVYLQGQGSTLYADKNDPKSGHIQDIEVPDGYVEDVAKSLIRPLAKGVLLNDWDEWVDGFVEGVAPLFEKQALDENGEASNGSGIITSSGKVNRRRADGTYPLGAYMPSYDWRLDPYVIAEDIHTYIGQVKAATGEEKVNLMGRSIGASVVMAYLDTYGVEDLDTVILYCPSFYGMEVMSKAFAGKVDIDPKSVNAFADYFAASGAADAMDSDTLQLLLDVISLTVSTHMLDLPAGMLERIYNKIYCEVYPKLLVRMYGSMPSFWSLVGDDDYEEAKKTIFGGQVAQYAELIKKIDNFHYNNLVRSADILSALTEQGAKIQIVAKYGIPMLPVVENADLQSDMLTSVYSATLGAECAPYGKTLSNSYVSAQTAAGKAKYISADLAVDASTCLLPEHTWFIKNIAHRDMPEGVNLLFHEILNYDGYATVFDDPLIPQFLYYSSAEGTLTPLKAGLDTDSMPARSFLTRFFNILRNIMNYLKKMFSR